MTCLRLVLLFLLACSDDASPPVVDGGRADANRNDAGLRCGTGFCDPGELCCEASGSCYDPACLSCCMPRSDAGAVDAASIDAGSTDSGSIDSGSEPDAGLDAGPPMLCGDGMCAPDEECCAATGRCYDPACLSCCMPIVPIDAGPPFDAGPAPADCRVAGCADGRLECCEVTGLCYDPRCLACCMFPPPPP